MWMAISVSRWARGGRRTSSLRTRRGEECARDSVTIAVCVPATFEETGVLELANRGRWWEYLVSRVSLSIPLLFIRDEECKMPMTAGSRLCDNSVTKPDGEEVSKEKIARYARLPCPVRIIGWDHCGNVFSPTPSAVEKKIDQMATSPRRFAFKILKGAPARRLAVR
jgi:hypothetical protein